jgi:hypothetical protein
MLGLMMNLTLKYLLPAITAIKIEKETTTSLVSCFAPLLHGMIIIISLFGSYCTKGKSNHQHHHHQQQHYVAPSAVALNNQLIPSQINFALEKMNMQIEKDKETRRDEHEQLKQMVLNMDYARRQNEEYFNHSHNEYNYTSTHHHDYHYNQDQQKSTPAILNPPYSSPLLQRYPNNNGAFSLPKRNFEFKSPRQRLGFMNKNRDHCIISSTMNPNKLLHTNNIIDHSVTSYKCIKNRSGSGTNANNECKSDWSEDCVSLQFLTPSPSPVPPEEDGVVNSFNNDGNTSDTDTNSKRLKTSANNDVITQEKKAKKRKIGILKEEQYDGQMNSTSNNYLDQDNDNKKQKKSY